MDLDIEVGPLDSGPVVGARALDLDLNISAGGGLRVPQDWTTSISFVLRKLKSHKKYGTFCIMDQQLNNNSKLNTFVVGIMKING